MDVPIGHIQSENHSIYGKVTSHQTLMHQQVQFIRNKEGKEGNILPLEDKKKTQISNGSSARFKTE